MTGSRPSIDRNTYGYGTHQGQVKRTVIQVYDAQLGAIEQVNIRYITRRTESCLVPRELKDDEFNCGLDACGSAENESTCKFERERASTSVATSSPYCSANWLVDVSS